MCSHQISSLGTLHTASAVFPHWPSFLSARPSHPNQLWVSISAPALTPLLSPTGHDLQGPEVLLKTILKHLCVQSLCRSTCTGPGSLHLHILSLISGCFPSVASPNFLFILIFTPTQWSACLCSPSYLLYLNFLYLGLISNELSSQNSSAKAFTWKRPSKTEK